MPTVKTVPGIWGTLTRTGTIPSEEIEARAKSLLAQMTLDEKIGQMSGDTPFLPGVLEMMRAYNTHPLPAGENLRLGIPGIRFSDGPRGVVMYHSTCFPVSMGRGASWDPDLEARIGDAIGVEARSQGANFFGGVCINLLRHPAWGRAQETYGEDPVLLGEMGAALVRGVQRHIMACIKHYAANSIENARMQVDVRIDDRALHEVYLPHFKHCVQAGAAAVMSAYNQVNGEYCGHNRRLLREILKQEWGFTGFVVSDFIFGIRNAKAAALGGLDIEMPFALHYRRRLKRLVRSGEVPEGLIDEAVLRILSQKLRFAGIGEAGRYGPQAVLSDDHRRLAREAARKSMVLLKNDPVEGLTVLPLDRARLKTLAVIGRLATVGNIGDHGSSRVRPPFIVTPLVGLQAAWNGGSLIHDPGRSLKSAARAARQADVAVVVAGYNHNDEGEKMPNSGKGGDRRSLRLSRHEEALIRAVASANPRTVVVLIGGSAVVTEAWRSQVPALLMAWYPGMEGGHALADVLFGDCNPGGKLPCSFPRSGDQLPFFDANARSIEYSYFHGYRLLEKKGQEPAFAFGYGLSYTTFRLDNLRLERTALAAGETLQVQVQVTNTGRVAGEEVLQLYTGPEQPGPDQPVKVLRAFRRLHLDPGETRLLTLPLPARELAVYAPDRQDWVIEPGAYRLYLGNSSRAQDLLSAAFAIRDPSPVSRKG